MKTVHLNPGANGKKDKPYSYCLSSDRVPIYYCTPINIIGIAVKKKFLKQYTSVKYFGTLQ